LSVGEAVPLRGFVGLGDTGAGLAGLRVEAWLPTHRGAERVAVTSSDDAGSFSLDLPAGLDGDGYSALEVELRVLDGKRLLLSEAREVLAGDLETIELCVPRDPAGVDEAEPEDDGGELWGRIEGAVPEDARVEAVLRTLSGGSAIAHRVVGQAVPNEAGWFRLRYERSGGGSRRSPDAAVSVRLRGADGSVLAEAAPVLARAARVRMDLGSVAGPSGPSEYLVVERRVASRLGAGVAGVGALDGEDLSEVATWIEVEPERLALFRQARALEAETGLPGALFYGLGRAGLGMTFESLADVSLHVLRTTIEEAAADGITCSTLLPDLDRLLERLASEVVDHVLRADRVPVQAGRLGDVLSAAGLPAETVRRVLRSHQAWTGPPAELWDSLTEGDDTTEGIDEGAGREAKLAVDLADLLGPDPALLRRVYQMRADGRWRSPQDLASLGVDDWRLLLEQLTMARATSGGEADPETAEEAAEAQEAIQAHAEAIVESLEEAFPSAFIRRRLIDSEDLGEPARRLLARAHDHDLVSGSIRDRVAEEPALIEGFDDTQAEAAVEELSAVERVSRVTERADEVAVLVGTGMRSAMRIAALPRRHFIDLYAEALGGRPQAARVHAQAQQTAAASKLAMISQVQAHQQTPFVLGGQVARAMSDIPDAEKLFGASGLCGCEHCRSVYSPAAYFIDLLHYLNVSDEVHRNALERHLRGNPDALAKLRAHVPLDVLLARRPDLAEIPLTCENTLTPLPYIDIVNEVLEARVIAGSAAFDTGKVPSDVLRAVPQNIAARAYARLQEAVYPIVMPYHEPLAVARAYLGHLGVPRLELLRVLGRGRVTDDAMTAEALGMSPQEHAYVAQPPAELWRHYGFTAEQTGGAGFVQALAAVPVFLSATGIAYQALIDLVSTRFVNADRALELASTTLDCDTSKVRLHGLDESRLSRMLRFIRLQRRLGWTTVDLDRALIALAATDLGPDVLQKLVEVQDLARRLDRPVRELLVLWAPLDAWGPDNQFDALLTTRAVTWRTQDKDTFQLRDPDRSELAKPGGELDAVAAALLAAFRITSDELALVRAIHTRRGASPRLDLSGISAVYRVVVLARALRLRIIELDFLLRMVPPDADPFRAGDPAATRRFVEIAREVQESELSVERLAYLFRHEVEPRRDPGPLQAQVQAVLAGIRRSLADAFAETAYPAEATADALRGKLAMLLDPALVDPVMESLDPRTPASVEKRRELFARHLARIFPDPSAAAARLFGDGAPATPAAGDLSEQRFKANVGFVLEHLLPQLRQRRMGGAVIQALSDTLGLTSPSTARLVEVVLRSRRAPGQPLIRDFLALVGTGVTGAYFANAELRGEPVLVRMDPELAFSWVGASPGEGVPAQAFSVRWRGFFLPRLKAAHVFYARTDGAVRLTVKLGGTEQVLIDRAGGSSRVEELRSEPIALDAAGPVEIQIEYRNQGGPASFALQVGTGPRVKQAVATTELYPLDGLSSFAPVEHSYRRLHKAAMILTGFGTTDAQLEWITGTPPVLDLDSLPMEAGTGSDPVVLFARWRRLAALYALRKKLPRSNVDLFDVFRASSLGDAIERIVLATGWDRAVVEAFAGSEAPALGLPAEASDEPLILRLARAVDLQRRVGVASATLLAWAGTTPDADMVATIVQAVKARYDEKRWLEVARTLNDGLRAERRDALVAYLLPRMAEQGVRNRSQLFEYFLIDVDMNPCMMTSRIRQAIGTVQTFFQRCLMNLEPEVPPRVIEDKDWKWLKSYRVWEANRKIFLYPENWIEPELRDDKSPLFEQLERAILQQEISKDNVESAFAGYLEGLDEISRLDVRGVFFEPRPSAGWIAGRIARLEPTGVRVPAPTVPRAPPMPWDHGTYHVFARTFNAPHVWYYRRLENGRAWSPWEKIDADIEGDHLVPVIFQRRLHLFWTVFREANKAPPPLESPRGTQNKAPSKLGKDWEISLAYAVYDRGRWSRKRMSTGGVRDVLRIHTLRKDALDIDGSTVLGPGDYTLRATLSDNPARLHLHLYRRAIDAVSSSEPRAPRVVLQKVHVDLIAVFDLDGCNGALSPDREHRDGGAYFVGTPKSPGRAPNDRDPAAFGAWVASHGTWNASNIAWIASRARVSHLHDFRISDGGGLNAPSGYQVDAMSFAASRAMGPSLLALPSPHGGGLARALGTARTSSRGVRIVPVVDPRHPAARGLFPFFFQDRTRSYFARPVYTNLRPARLVAVPLVGPAVVERSRSRKALSRTVPAARRGRTGGRGRREEIGEIDGEAFAEIEMAPEARDAREAEQDDTWHPEDAAEARGRSRPRPAPLRRAPARRTPARPQRAPVRTQPPVRMQRQEAYHEQQLRFSPFEHPATCRFIMKLRGAGIEGLLDFGTTRPGEAIDHQQDKNGAWRLHRPTWFEKTYAPGPLVDTSTPPHLDVDFDPDGPYSLYNWELFFHAPLQVATRLAKDGRHEEAQRWFHFIFDPTTDASSPPPRRYWRFAPFHENDEYAGAREIMSLLSYSGEDPDLIRRHWLVRDQLTAWWEKPFSPHVIARLRTVAYQKAVVMKYIDNLIEWGDKLFRRDTLETIQEATQLYILAGNILGPRPERIPAMIEHEPLTFQRLRGKLDLFANYEVRFENQQSLNRRVRRPFRIAARPDVSGATSVLNMATHYFCLPVNSQLDKYWDTVADRLFKIRNCMNIQGIVRQLPLFEPPIDPGLLVRAAAAGVDLGSVIASLNAPPPPYRFRYLLARSLRLAEELRSFGAMTTKVLERRDAEGLAALRASGETALLEAVREIRKKQVRQVEEQINQLGLEREHVEIQSQHITTQMAELMSPQEAASQKSLSLSQVISGLSEASDLVAKVLHAIPEFQTGGAGVFASPFVTLQLGGQMFGDIATAFAESLQKVMARNETESDMAEKQAEYQRRREEWQHELELLAKEKAKVDKQIAEVNLALEISSAELHRHDVEVENARKVERYLRDKYTNEQLYGWMLGQLSGVYFQAYKVSFDAAQQAERAYRFERGEPSASFVEFSYWDSLKKGLFAGERLLVDLRRMESSHVEGDRRALEVMRNVSLRDDFPLAFEELVATGRCQIAITEHLLDGDFPGHYFRRTKSVSLTAVGVTRPHSNVNCTLTLLENRIRTDANASGSYAQTDDNDDPRFLVNFAPVQAVATSRPSADAGVFELRFDDDRYLPFEGSGAVSTWRIDLHQADNSLDIGELDDLILTLAYTARNGGAALEAAARASREKGLARGDAKPPAQHTLNVKRDLAAQWKRLAEAPPGQEVEIPLPLDPERFSGRYRGLDLRIERATLFARARGPLAEDVLRVRLDPPKGSGASATGWTRPWPASTSLRASAEVSGPPGAWKLVVSAIRGTLPDHVANLVLVFDLRARLAT
jgi:hypothetical protein